MGQAGDAAADTTTMIMMTMTAQATTGDAMGMDLVAAMDTVRPVRTIIMMRRIRKRFLADAVAAVDAGHKIPDLIGFLFILDI